MLWGLSFDPSHRTTDGATAPPRDGAQLQPIYYIHVGFRLIRPKPKDKFMTKH